MNTSKAIVKKPRIAQATAAFLLIALFVSVTGASCGSGNSLTVSYDIDPYFNLDRVEVKVTSGNVEKVYTAMSPDPLFKKGDVAKIDIPASDFPDKGEITVESVVFLDPKGIYSISAMPQTRLSGSTKVVLSPSTPGFLVTGPDRASDAVLMRSGSNAVLLVSLVLDDTIVYKVKLVDGSSRELLYVEATDAPSLSHVIGVSGGTDYVVALDPSSFPSVSLTASVCHSPEANPAPDSWLVSKTESVTLASDRTVRVKVIVREDSVTLQPEP